MAVRERSEQTVLKKIYHTNSTALIHPSFSGLLVTCAYLPINGEKNQNKCADIYGTYFHLLNKGHFPIGH